MKKFLIEVQHEDGTFHTKYFDGVDLKNVANQLATVIDRSKGIWFKVLDKERMDFIPQARITTMTITEV